MKYAERYLSYITAILGIEYPIPHHRRIPISTVSNPSIFHAKAVNEFNQLAYTYMLLFMDMERMR